MSRIYIRSLSQPAASRRAEKTGFYRVDSSNAITPLVCRAGPIPMVQLSNFAQ
jgi:hypothetical protein